ncbi:hypothetical protein IAQ61_002642 [Plenodomus lingam]|uniref:uncharacterized protein n=1 Tax=Leptosphaeria maculans TaxID=5022 RepID=UPI00332C8E7F|nr:hypothetical protein IAQ61_002642 [Plenodomus lingam]
MVSGIDIEEACFISSKIPNLIQCGPYLLVLIHLWNATISFEAKEKEWLVNRVQLTTTVPLDKCTQLSLNHFSVSGYLHPKTLFRSMDTPMVDGVALVLDWS